MNLIRNGGFELGGIQFWEEVANSTLEVQGIEKLHGTYAGKVTAAAGIASTVKTSDYIGVTPFSTLLLNVAYLSTDIIGNDITVLQYDGDGVSIGSFNLDAPNFTGVWQDFHRYVHIPANTFYIQVLFSGAATGANDVYYLDDIGLVLIDPTAQVTQVVELCDLKELVASGNTIGSKKELLGFKDYYAELVISAWAGTNPTGDITIIERSGLGSDRTLATFVQVVGGYSKQFISFAARPAGPVYVKYVIGGTLTDGDIQINMIGSQ